MLHAKRKKAGPPKGVETCPGCREIVEVKADGSWCCGACGATSRTRGERDSGPEAPAPEDPD